MARKSNHQLRVELFLGAGGHSLPGKPTEASRDIRILQAKLLMEETLEAIEAMGVRMYCCRCDNAYNNDANSEISGPCDLPHLAKELADVKVVATGTMSLFGMADEAIQEAVDENNIAKIGARHTVRADGKLVKDPAHKPPDIASLLRDMTNGPDSSS